MHGKMTMTGKNGKLDTFILEASDYPDWIGVDIANAMACNGYGDTLLHVAACQNRVDMIGELLNCGVPVNQKGEHGYTALHEAVEQGSYWSALYLIKMGADLSMMNDFGQTPLDLLPETEKQQ